ncbi:RING-H2 finger protein ATL5P [Hordeum vulgare]|nr:RING-H2 finger protein ATL5P [Hordeum vulgare]
MLAAPETSEATEGGDLAGGLAMIEATRDLVKIGGATEVLVDMIRVPDWAFEAVGLELRGMGQDTAYHPGLYLTIAQREVVEALIQELPKFMLKAVPTD